MTDEQSPRSGSRWEPGATSEGETAETESDAGGAAGLPPYAGVTSQAYTPPPRRRWRDRVGRRGLAVAGGAAALVLVSGVGGFAIGHAVGEHDHLGPGDPRFREVGFHENGPLPPGFGQGQPPPWGGDQDGDGYGPGAPGQGTLPDQGTTPGQGGSPSANPNQQSGTTT